MIRLTLQYLFGTGPYPRHRTITQDESLRRSEENACRVSEAVIARHRTITQDESLRRSEENACRVSEAVIAANEISTARLPSRYRELYRTGCRAKCQNDPQTARRVFREALQSLPPSAEFNEDRAFIEGEIRQLSQALRGYRLHTLMWKGIAGMAIVPTAVALSLIRKQQQ